MVTGDLSADFRSDTLTLPSQGMREAMCHAELGDDVFGEDPTVNALQNRFSELTEKQAALFFPSGSMANLAAIMVHARPGTVLYAGAACHIHHYELGSYATLAGLALKEVEDGSGYLDLEDLRNKWNPDIYYMPQPGLVTVENTHNMLGGKIYPVEELKKLRQFTSEKNVPLHMDGARLLHAAAGTDKAASEWTRNVDSVMISISKGMGCPVGSVLCGSGEFIQRARVIRKMLGGGMRQAGIIAAAGLYALNHHLPLLQKDIQRAHAVYHGTQGHENLKWVPPESNILIGNMPLGNAADLVHFLAGSGVKALAIHPHKIRFVFHLNNTDAGCQMLKSGIQKWLTR